MVELERSLIAERVRAGLRNARARGVRLGRLKAVGDPERIAVLRRSGASWRAIGRELGLSAETVKKMALARSKIRSTGFLATIADAESRQRAPDQSCSLASGSPE